MSAPSPDYFVFEDAELIDLHLALNATSDPVGQVRVLREAAHKIAQREVLDVPREQRRGRASLARLTSILGSLANTRFASLELFEARLALCASCEHYAASTRGEAGKMMRRCDVCGCFMHLKARFSSQRCPLGKF